MPDDADLMLLRECYDQLELGLARSLLDAHGISYVVQAEHHSALLMGNLGGGPVTPRVLVAARDLERAAAVLAAAPGAHHHEAPSIADSECPVHLKAAVATCDRCGTWLCAECNALGAPPLCEDCVEIESADLKPSTPRQVYVRAQLAWLIPTAVVGVAVLILAAVFGR